ncbi:UTP--glucose-1-phosphate uridylyltransferase [Ruaniaceae bacterium KH17]|nr:UTP--glucose-1-phosphate uridylyltransferase [Ruaniaceae bacterium KH17]
MEGLHQALEKMRAAGTSEPAIRVFEHNYAELAAGQTGVIPEDTIEPLLEPDRFEDVEFDGDRDGQALAATALIKLNGGLGTSMGMSQAKSLLPVRDGKSFLDITLDQVRAARARYGVRLPLVFMNSFSTEADTRAALAAHDDIVVGQIPLDFLQSAEPKLAAEGLTPIEWPADPDLEWCPPGHGDLYPSLLGSGTLGALIDAGFRYACVSNSDNLGAAPSAEIASWFAASGAPFAMEVCRRTEMDKKGGHLARRRFDGRLILRETSQTAPEERRFFEDISRHRYFNTNTLWFDLHALHEALIAHDGVLGLPLIRNSKTVDPRDSTSPAVIQIETAMGAAIEVFAGARVLEVPRERFLPVKTTSDLLLIQSDAFELDGDSRLIPVAAPVVELAPGPYRRIADFEERFAEGAPSLREAVALTVRGDWKFGSGVRVTGAVELGPEGGVVPDNAHLNAANAY